MSAQPYTENNLVEQPTIGLIAELQLFGRYPGSEDWEMNDLEAARYEALL